MAAGTAVAISHAHRVHLGKILSLMRKDTVSAVPPQSRYYTLRSEDYRQLQKKKVISESSLIGPQICGAKWKTCTFFSFLFDFSSLLAHIFQIVK